MISVVLPVLDEAVTVERSLLPLQALRGSEIEVLVVDGGSRDATRRVAHPLCDRMLEASRGRARQMNAGAGIASGSVLLFLHADTRLPSGWTRLVRDAVGIRAREWGRFDVRLDGRHPMLRIVRARDEPAFATERHRHRRSGDLRSRAMRSAPSADSRTSH